MPSKFLLKRIKNILCIFNIKYGNKTKLPKDPFCYQEDNAVQARKKLFEVYGQVVLKKMP